MFGFLRAKTSSVGSILFPGAHAPRLEQLVTLSKSAVRVELGESPDACHWKASLVHEDWGNAELFSFREPMPAPDRELLELDPRLNEKDVNAICGCRASLELRMIGTRRNVLRDRKNALRFMNAVLGDDGVCVIDRVSQTTWTHAALNDELFHDADLDVQSLFTLHAVADHQGSITWLHSHGLGELGAYDFDVLCPGKDLLAQHNEFTRAVAFAIVEGELKVGDTMPLMRPGGDIHMMSADRFMREADTSFAKLRDDPDRDHVEKRAVVCDKPKRGLFGLGAPKVEPCTWIRESLPNELVLDFSTAASNLMAERARNTYSVLQYAAQEVAEFQFPALVKLGYVVDGGGADDKEHLWFEVHETHDDRIDCTLVNQPFNISRMSPGQRADHPVERLSDWAVMTPMGRITPRDVMPLRVIRNNRERLREAIARAGND